MRRARFHKPTPTATPACLDLDADTIADLREAKRDWESGDRSAFVPLAGL